MLSRFLKIDKNAIRDVVLGTSVAVGMTYYITSDHFLNFIARFAFKNTSLKNKIDVGFENLSGCVFCGKYIGSKVKVKKGHFELEADRVLISFPFSHLIESFKEENPIHFELISIKGLTGWTREENPKTPNANFLIDELDVQNADVNYFAEADEPVRIQVNRFHTTTPFDASRTLYSFAFESHFDGSIDDAAIKCDQLSKNKVKWAIEDLKVSTIAKFEGNSAMMMLASGKVSMNIEAYKTDHDIDMKIGMNVRDLVPEIRSPLMVTSIRKYLLDNQISLSIDFPVSAKKEKLMTHLPRTMIDECQQAVIIAALKHSSESLTNFYDQNIKDGPLDYLSPLTDILRDYNKPTTK